MGKVANQTKAQKVNVNRSCKSRGCGMKDQCLTSGDPTHISKGMVEKGLERESDDVKVGESRRTETIYSTNRYVQNNT